MAVAPTLVPRCFSFPLPSEDGVLHIQLLELGRQTFVWLGVGQPALGSLSAAVPLRAGVPAVTDLLGGGEGAALAQRLALRTGRAVVVACSLTDGSPLLLAVAEKHLVTLLRTSAERSV